MIVVTCAILEREGKILCAQRGLNMSMPGKWEFPGGKLEETETLEECLVREISEELGYVVSVGKALERSEWCYENGVDVCLHPFVCHIESGELQLLEHSEIRWLERGDLLGLDWAEADLPIVNKLINNNVL